MHYATACCQSVYVCGSCRVGYSDGSQMMYFQLGSMDAETLRQMRGDFQDGG